MDVQEREAIVRRFIDQVVSAGSDDGPARWDSFVVDGPQVGGNAGFKERLTALQTAIPDLRYEVESLVVEGDTVTVRGAARGTHLADFRDVPPSGKAVTVETGLVFQLGEDRIVTARFQPVGSNFYRQVREQWEAGQPWYKLYSGGMWEAEGRRQLAVLVENGLQPHHYLLDLGCGTLRGGVKLIDYLEPGHYYGVDVDDESLEGAREALRETGLEGKGPHIGKVADCDFASLRPAFDYILAYSVFTELPLNSIIRILMNVERVLGPEGKLYATFWQNPDGKRNLDPIKQPGGAWTFFDQYPYHYDFETFEWICTGTGLRVEYFGLWAGRGPQHLMVFRRR